MKPNAHGFAARLKEGTTTSIKRQSTTRRSLSEGQDYELVRPSAANRQLISSPGDPWPAQLPSPLVRLFPVPESLRRIR